MRVWTATIHVGKPAYFMKCVCNTGTRGINCDASHWRTSWSACARVKRVKRVCSRGARVLAWSVAVHTFGYFQNYNLFLIITFYFHFYWNFQSLGLLLFVKYISVFIRALCLQLRHIHEAKEQKHWNCKY